MPQNRKKNINKASSFSLPILSKFGTYAYLLIYALLSIALILYFLLNQDPSKYSEAYSALTVPNKDTGQTFHETFNSAEKSTQSTKDIVWEEYIIKRGDNLSSIFKKKSLSTKDVFKLSSKRLAVPLIEIQPDQKIQFGYTSQGYLEKLKYIKSKSESYIYTRINKKKDANFQVKRVSLGPKIITTYRDSIIKDSLYLSAKKNGLPHNVIMKLSKIFSWDIDFVFDIRKGDKFSVLYEEHFYDGSKVVGGNILAAEFVNKGVSYKAVRYQDTNGKTDYYTPEGYDMRKTFIRAPLDFTRISSSFDPKRMHPIHKKVMAHRGVDYAAPLGTPIYAAGDGRVTASNYNRANGNYIFINHGGGITTKYLHLRKRRVMKGARVIQLQIIGEVGSTGYSTGPHLHYEFLVDGIHKDPQKVDLPDSNPINKQELDRFYKNTSPLFAKLKEYQRLSELAF
ncbi:MAG: peptidase M23 [Porticoccus sp.]|jgi:murein DD-endopeptidase MepM/ murein hydrolase activator NlpD|nr:peptidase M23 [Porticoccus sp.]